MPISAKRLSKVFSSFSREPSSNGSAPDASGTDGKAATEAPVVKPAAPESDKKEKTEEAEVAKTEKPLPTFDELPMFKNMPGCAWSVWGENDQLGTVNMLTEEVVARAAKEEMKLGKCVSLNWPLNFPDKPLYGRRTPEVKMGLRLPAGPTRDDEIHINTQSGTQWDGLRHFGIVEHGVFYNNSHKDSMPLGIFRMPDPNNIDPSIKHIGIQNWADHGICGRGVFLDLVRYKTKAGEIPLPYDPWTTHGISVAELEECARAEGVTFRRGDILLLRVGWIQKYYKVTTDERDALAGRSETSAGIEQSDDMKWFLWNNHFAAIASDQPALESWPVPQDTPHLHQTILGLWGMPLGEFFDLEKLSQMCAELGRYTFFFSSWPLNIIGGCASPPNAAAYF